MMDTRTELHTRNFTVWINAQLDSVRGDVIASPAELVGSFKTGVRLAQLYLALTGSKIKVKSSSSFLSVQRAQIDKVLSEFKKDPKLRLQSHAATDFQNGHAKLVLSFIWQLIVRFDLSSRGKTVDVWVEYIQNKQAGGEQLQPVSEAPVVQQEWDAEHQEWEVEFEMFSNPRPEPEPEPEPIRSVEETSVQKTTFEIQVETFFNDLPGAGTDLTALPPMNIVFELKSLSVEVLLTVLGLAQVDEAVMEHLVMGTLVMSPPEKREALLEMVSLLQMGRFEGVSPEVLVKWRSMDVLPSVHVVKTFAEMAPEDLFSFLTEGPLDDYAKDLLLEGLLSPSLLSSIVASSVEDSTQSDWSVQFEFFFNNLPSLKPDAIMEQLRTFAPAAREVVVQLLSADTVVSIDWEAVMAPMKTKFEIEVEYFYNDLPGDGTDLTAVPPAEIQTIVNKLTELKVETLLTVLSQIEVHEEVMQNLIINMLVMLEPQKRVVLLEMVSLLQMGRFEGVSPEVLVKWRSIGVLPSVRVVETLTEADSGSLLSMLNHPKMDTASKDLLLEGLLSPSLLSSIVASSVEDSTQSDWSVQFEFFFNNLPSLKPDAIMEQLRTFAPAAREVVVQLLSADTVVSIDWEAFSNQVPAPQLEGKHTIVTFDQGACEFDFVLTEANIPFRSVDLDTPEGQAAFRAHFSEQQWVQEVKFPIVDAEVEFPIVDVFGEVTVQPSIEQIYTIMRHKEIRIPAPDRLKQVPELIIYSNMVCPISDDLLKALIEEGYKFRFANCDEGFANWEMFKKCEVASWYGGDGRVGLPVVDAYGGVVMRPSFDEIKDLMQRCKIGKLGWSAAQLSEIDQALTSELEKLQRG